VWPDFWVVQTFNGVSCGALLFLRAGGLSLIFGGLSRGRVRRHMELFAREVMPRIR